MGEKSVNIISDSDGEGRGNSSDEEESLIFDLQPYDDTAGDYLNGIHQSQIRLTVERLVKELAPDLADNYLDAMFVQFAGREEDLLKTLYKMCNRRDDRRVHVVE